MTSDDYRQLTVGSLFSGIVPHDLCLEMIASCRKETPKGWFF